jgi:aconitate hydratase
LNPMWNEIPAPTGQLYKWDAQSTYIQDPPFFEKFSLATEPIVPILGMRALGIFGDSITTDHISPAGSIKKTSPAGAYLLEHGVSVEEFNSYGSRRGNDRVMTRGTFANLRIRNLMVPGVEGGFTRNILTDSTAAIPIFDAAQIYSSHGIPLIVFGGKEYGTGSSRDWAAKGTRLLGVKVVVAESFERIHRSNLVGMGVLPCSLEEGISAQSLKLDGSEAFSLPGLNDTIQPRQTLQLEIKRANGTVEEIPVVARLDTHIEIEYYRHGGILPFMLRQLLEPEG